MPFFLFSLMNLLVGMSSFLLTYKIVKVPGFVDGVLAWFVLSLGQIVASHLLLGMVGGLTLSNIILFNAAVALTVYLCARQQGSSFSATGLWPFLETLIRDRAVRLCVAVIVGFGLVKAAINLVNPPFGWDDLNYHFTFPVEWLKTGILDCPITVFDDPSPSYYPINGSLFFLWLIWPFKSVFLADLGQVPFFIAAFLAVFSLGRKCDLDARQSFLAACLFTLIPNYFKQLSVAYVDVMVAALFLIALTFLFSLQKRRDYAPALVCSLATGLMVGTKTPALLYAGVIFLPFFFLAVRSGKRGAFFLSLLCVCVIAFGGFSYLRNALLTGNPFYPMEVAIGAKALLRGVMDHALYRVHFIPSDYRLDKLLFHEGLGAQTILFVLPGILAALPVYLAKRRTRATLWPVYLFISPLVLYVLWRYVIPLANVRYLYNLLALGVLFGWYVFTRCGLPRTAMTVLTVLSVLASAPELAKKAELIAGVMVALAAFFLLPFLVTRRRFALYGALSLLLFLFWSEGDYIKNEYARYVKMVQYSGFWPEAAKAWEYLNSVTTGNRIAYAGRPVPFPLYGTHFKNSVSYVSVNTRDPATLHAFPEGRYRWGHDFESVHRSFGEAGNYRADSSFSAWQQNLRRRAIEYLFVYSLHQTKTVVFPAEEEWAQMHPEMFVSVFRNQTIRIYKILR